MNKIILFYKYTDIAYPKQVMKWQQQICQELELKGRILISHEGINGTLGGSAENLDTYKELMSAHELFGNIDFKESAGGPECFPRLSVKVRNEAVSLGIPYDQLTPRNAGQHLTPQETHELLSNKPEDLIILDARNNYEWEIGKFENAITPNIENFRDLPQYLDAHLDQFADKQVLMYCTGGIRCERATAYLNEKNVAKKVYQMDGGIHRYAEQYPDGFFRGKNYVFDGRISVKINDDILGSCAICAQPCDDYYNCLNAMCNKHFISCTPCISRYDKTCSEQCQILLAEKKVNQRPEFQKNCLI
ncbi:MAG TPA: rhodanese-related sulfurtransferase [Candidatus Babeliales bacterium]|nr:rhodanese-related sulfurtransferase [Candidatus Babeliales bacterium]